MSFLDIDAGKGGAGRGSSPVLPTRSPGASFNDRQRSSAAALAAFGVSQLLGLPPLAQSVLILQMSMPVAVYNYLFAQRARREPEYVAGLVFCSTLLSFLYLPVLLALMM